MCQQQVIITTFAITNTRYHHNYFKNYRIPV